MNQGMNRETAINILSTIKKKVTLSGSDHDAFDQAIVTLAHLSSPVEVPPAEKKQEVSAPKLDEDSNPAEAKSK